MSAIETAMKTAAKVTEEVSKINAVAGLLAGAGTLLAGLGACGIGTIITTIINNKKENDAK